MATIKGSTVTPEYDGYNYNIKWYAQMDYSISGTGATDTTVTLTINNVRTYSTKANTSSTKYGIAWESDGTANISVAGTGQTTQTKTTKATPTTTGTYTYNNWGSWSAFSWARGHSATTKTITVKGKLANYWVGTISNGSPYTATKNTGPQTSTATLTVNIPAKTSYAVTLDLNGGSGAATSLTKWYGESLTLPQPTKEYYSFAGWAASSAPTTVVYQPGAAYTTNATASLIAVWTPIISGAYITNIYTARDNGSGTWVDGKHTSAQDEGKYVYTRVNWRVDGAAAATVSVDAIMKDASNQTVWTGTTDTASKSSSVTSLEGVSDWVTSTEVADINQKYKVTVNLSTGSGNPTATKSAVLSTAFFTMDVLAGGHGIAFGKPATREIVVQTCAELNQRCDFCGFQVENTPTTYTRQSVDANGTLYLSVYQSGAPTYQYYFSNAGNIARRQWVNGAWGKLTYYTPNYIAGDSVTLNGYVTDGFLTNGRKDCEVCIKLSRSLYGVSSATVTGTVIVRQNNAYLFGSTDSTGADLSGFTNTATVNSNGFIRFRFSGTEQTSGVNNSPIAVYFQTLTITFA